MTTEIITAELVTPDAVECDLCNATMPTVDAAIDADWEASYFIDGEETGYPICPKCVETKCKMTVEGPELFLLLGGLSREAIRGSIANNKAKEARRDASNFRCALPDWTGQGGIHSFWLNGDGTYESMDSRIDDQEIRRGMELLSRENR